MSDDNDNDEVTEVSAVSTREPRSPELDLAMRQQLLDQGAQQLAHVLHQATGQPPQAIILLVHWPQDVMFSASMASASPQAQMNAIDRLLAHCATVGQKLKAAVNAVRHGAKPGAPKH